MEKQISIIIPTYNMEAYIGKCLDSLLIPEFDAVEVLVVNDGSRDRSSEIAHSYADRYPASIHVIDKPNGNYGSCINAALPLATGRYVKVLDADDTFDTDAFSRFVQILPKIDDDAVITSYLSVDENGDTIKKHDYSGWKIQPNYSYNVQHAINLFLNRYIDMHRITYSMRIFKNINYHQTEGISYTDTEWAIIPLSACQRFRFINLYLYRYLQGREGQTMDPKNISRNLNHLFIILKRLVLTYVSINDNNHRKLILYNHIRNRHKTTYFFAISAHHATAMTLLKDYDTGLRDKCPEMYEAVGNIRYTPNVRYCVFDHLRKIDYPVNYNTPLWVKVLVSASSKFKKVFHV